MAGGSSKAVYAALFGNFCITVLKFIAAFFSGSSSMLAEAYHSVTDTFNQVFLLIGIKRSRKKPTKLHPYGYGKEQFFWAFVVSMLLFGIAGVMSIMEGYNKLRHPEPIGHVYLSLIVLCIAFVFEGYALLVAGKQLKKEMKKEQMRSIMAAIKHSKDPTVLTVVFEDTLALVSISIAAIAIGLTHYTGNGIYDAVASLIIGSLLMVFALVLAGETKHLLIGESISNHKRKKIVREIGRMKHVNEVLDFRTMHLSPEETLVTMEVNLKDELVTDEVEKIINRIEVKVRKVLPKAKCYVEAEEMPSRKEKKRRGRLFK